MSDLIARLEAAEAGSRELDGDVWYAVHEPDVEYGALHIEQTDQGPIEVLTCELGSKYADCVENYTTSLDATLALASRVLPGFGWGAVQGSGERAKANVTPANADHGFTATASTPALALCAAILRAKGSDQ